MPDKIDQNIGNVNGEGGAQTAVGIFHGSVTFAAAPGFDTKQGRIDECLNALYLADPAADRERLVSAKGKRARGTCEWILEIDEYKRWVNGETPLLWICGSPGKGKTMLSVYLTQELEKVADGPLVLYFFCSNQSADRNTALSILRSLVWQLCTARPELIERILPKFKSQGQGEDTVKSVETLWIIFVSLLNHDAARSIYVILDGLDECEEESWRWMVTKVTDLLACDRATHASALKLAILSRNLPGLHRAGQINLDDGHANRLIGADIGKFVSSRVDDLSGLEGFDDRFRSIVEVELLARCEDTYLWVGFAMIELLKKRTCVEVEMALRMLPPGLFRMYDYMLLQVKPADEVVCSSILKWVFFATRPLHINELVDAVDIEPSSRLTKSQQIRDYVKLCGPLVKIQLDDTVQLVHQSARDFLRESNDKKSASIGRVVEQSQPGHFHLARTCLMLLEQFWDKHSHLSSSERTQVSQGHGRKWTDSLSIFGYALKWWAHHAREASTLAVNLLDRVFFSSGLLQSRVDWSYEINHFSTLYGFEETQSPLLHFASFLGILPWMTELLKQRQWKHGFRSSVNIPQLDRQGMERNALWYAVSGEHESAVRLLIEHGAHAPKNENPLESTMALGVRTGSTTIVRMLLESRADATCAAVLAAQFGHEEIVRLFLDRGVDPSTMLQTAATFGRDHIVELLLSRGADVNTLTTRDHLLRLALYNCDPRSFRELVRGTIDAHYVLRLMDREDDICPSLQHAMLARSTACMKLLLSQKGIDVNLKSLRGNTALNRACEMKLSAIAQQLLKLGADVNARGIVGRTPLFFAASQLGAAFVEELIWRGAVVNAQDEEGFTPLTYMLREWDTLHDSIKKKNLLLLLDRGADMNVETHWGETAVWYAAWMCKSSYLPSTLPLRLLVERGANVIVRSNLMSLWTILIDEGWSEGETADLLGVASRSDFETRERDCHQGRTPSLKLQHEFPITARRDSPMFAP